MMWTIASMTVGNEPGVGDIAAFRACSPPPVFHMAAFGYCMAHLLFGATVILPTQMFNPQEVLQLIDREKVISILLIPAMANFLLAMPDLDKYDTNSLKVWISGASVLPTDTRKRFKECFPEVQIFDCFGQTESTGIISILGPADAERKQASVGKALPYVEIRVVDEEDRDVPLGEPGEAIYRGPNMTQGYYKNPEANARALRGGWFHSGDVVRQDEEGFFYIVDRKTDMIVSGGENIYPAEVEEVLYHHPKILEAAVIGVHDDEWGESVKAIVVPKRGETLTEDEVIEFCKDHLASYKKPKSVDFIDALPRNPAMKVLKTVLREKYGKAIRY
jgi:acyl-CoA synthetase (AMP-forming)/AMP-acid ligase II